MQVVDNYYDSDCVNCRYNTDKEYQMSYEEALKGSSLFTVIFCEKRRINMMRFPIRCDCI